MTETQQHYDANDILMGGGGAPTLKLDQLGVEVGGSIVTKPIARQETEFGTNKPKTFPSGDPIMGILVDVQTSLRDASIEDDSGVRRLYVEGKRLKEAVRDAVRNSGAPGLEVGGQLYVAWTGTGTPASAGVSGPKLYQARYIPAATAVLGVQQPAPAQQITYAAPPQQPAPAQTAPAQTAPAANAPSAEAIAALKAAGVDPATVYPGWTG